MQGARVLLASASPRRRELLEAAGFRVEVRPSHTDESWPEAASPDSAVQILARRKLGDVTCPDGFVVAADTVVVHEGRPLGKPESPQAATEMLDALSGGWHEVWTGFCVRGQRDTRSGAVCTRVSFRRLFPAEIERYVVSGEPLDKAGAYAIQGRGGILVDQVQGSYTNVVGLPLAEVIAVMEAMR